MENFLTVAQQVVVLFLLIAVGFILAKKNIITDNGAKVCSDIALFVATPCVIIRSFCREVSGDLVIGLLLAIGTSFLIHGIGIAVAHLCFRKKDDRHRVYRMAVVFSNAGFMALPLQQAILGDDGVLYGAAYVAVFNITLWSYGQILMDKNTKTISVGKVLINPGTLGLIGGLLVLLSGVQLPTVLSAPINHLANLNTPLPMLFIGYYLSKVDFKKALRRVEYFGVSAVRLIVVPCLSAAILYLCGASTVFLTSMVIAATAPVAASVPMFATRYERDTESAVSLVALSTVLSLITMPILIALIQAICK